MCIRDSPKTPKPLRCIDDKVLGAQIKIAMTDAKAKVASSPAKVPIAGWDSSFKGISSNMYSFVLTPSGMQSKKVSPWDAVTEELNIPDIEEEGPTIKEITKAPVVMQRVVKVSELDKNLSLNLPHQIEGVDIGPLLQVVGSQNDLVEKDVEWNYKSLQAEMTQAYNEVYEEYHENE
eukprot:TRINITY_DN1092_c0_g1_i5.p2 TRINITY_DN1092_c0_g1~~TRINITY_DN1092_c0_g1_i5.p2  ORF type:complete len:177 (+),score=58.90 TRINITY_DN1092_c0_g1_i5:78-608(+)